MTARASTRVGYVGYVGQWSLLTDPGLQYFVFSPVTGPSLAFKRWWSLSFRILIYICFLFDSSVFLNLFQIFSCHKMEMWVTSLKDMLSFLLHSFVLLSLISFFFCLVYWLWGLLSLKVGGKDYLANITQQYQTKGVGKQQTNHLSICLLVHKPTHTFYRCVFHGQRTKGVAWWGAASKADPPWVLPPSACFDSTMQGLQSHVYLPWVARFLFDASFTSLFLLFFSSLFISVLPLSAWGFFFFRSLPFFCLLNFFAWVCV